MKYICDASQYTWFRIETVGEAALESQAMNHAVERHFRVAYEEASRSYVPPRSAHAFEESIGRNAYIQKVMPIFVTLRDSEGKVLVTGMLPPEGQMEDDMRPIIVGHSNTDPYAHYSDAIEALAEHLDLDLDEDYCYPYNRG